MDDISNLGEQSYQNIRKSLQSGDILLCSGSSVFSELIKRATNSIWSHVGFILALPQIDRYMVLESVESIGVRTVPLSSYVRDYNNTRRGYPGKLLIARHRDMKTANLANLSRHAVDLLGRPYDKDEIAKIAARLSLHALGIYHAKETVTTERPAFICSEYAYACFESVGVHVDFNPLGFVTPADFANSAKVKPITYLSVENQKVARQVPA